MSRATAGAGDASDRVARSHPSEVEYTPPSVLARSLPDSPSSRTPSLASQVVERMRGEPERLASLAARAEAALGDGPGFAILDMRWLFPEGLGEALRRSLLEDRGEPPEVLLRVDKNRYRGSKADLHPSHRDLLRPFFDFVDDVFTRIARRDGGGEAPSAWTSMEIRAIGVGSEGEPETERWHRDGTFLSGLVTLTGPATVIAPVGRFVKDENRFVVDETELLIPRPGELLLMSGGGRSSSNPNLGTIHHAPPTTEPQLMLVCYFYASL